MTGGVYRSLGTAAEALKLDARELILDTLAYDGNDAITEPELTAKSNISKGTVGKALRELLGEGSVKRMGEGKRNNAYKYYRTSNSFSQPYIKAWKKENLNGKTGGHLVQMALDMGARITGIREDDLSETVG